MKSIIILLLFNLLLVIFGALIALIVISKKKNETTNLFKDLQNRFKNRAENPEQPTKEENDERKPLLKVEQLCQYFSVGGREFKAVDGVSFDIYKGEVFGLVGESGCGKTTTGRSIIRLYDITGGSVYFDGKRICAGIRQYENNIKNARIRFKEETKTIASLLKTKEISVEEANDRINKAEKELHETISYNVNEIKLAKYDHKYCNKEYSKFAVEKVKEKYADLLYNTNDSISRVQLEKDFKEEIRIAKKERIMNKIQMIFQDPIASLDPRMTVRDIIAEGLIIRGIKDKDYIDKKVFEILETVGLVPEHASRYPHEFSGGQRQRIGIARAIILNPELIIADEPISALDVSIQAQVINLLNELSEKMGLTTLFIAHDLAVVKYFSNRIAVMYYGHIVELASSDELFKFPFHPYTRSLLSAIPVPDPYTEKNRTRVTYNPMRDHDYSEEGPIMREVYPGHFVLCNSQEEVEYRTQYLQEKNK